MLLSLSLYLIGARYHLSKLRLDWDYVLTFRVEVCVEDENVCGDRWLVDRWPHKLWNTVVHGQTARGMNQSKINHDYSVILWEWFVNDLNTSGRGSCRWSCIAIDTTSWCESINRPSSLIIEILLHVIATLKQTWQITREWWSEKATSITILDRRDLPWRRHQTWWQRHRRPPFTDETRPLLPPLQETQTSYS